MKSRVSASNNFTTDNPYFLFLRHNHLRAFRLCSLTEYLRKDSKIVSPSASSLKNLSFSMIEMYTERNVALFPQLKIKHHAYNYVYGSYNVY